MVALSLVGCAPFFQERESVDYNPRTDVLDPRCSERYGWVAADVIQAVAHGAFAVGAGYAILDNDGDKQTLAIAAAVDFVLAMVHAGGAKAGYRWAEKCAEHVAGRRAFLTEKINDAHVAPPPVKVPATATPSVETPPPDAAPPAP